MPRRYPTWQQRLLARIDKNGPVPAHKPELGQCHLWTGSVDTAGYGQLSVDGRLELVHRAMFLLTHGRLPELAMHECDTPRCCNPEHVKDGTKALNNADKMSKGRFRPCIGDANGARLHPERVVRGDSHYLRKDPSRALRGVAHGMAKLTPELVAGARKRFALGGITKAALALELGISPSHMGRILGGESWVECSK